MKKAFIFFLAVLLVWAGENYFSPDKVLAFAEYLMQEGDWLRAAGELERYIFLRKGKVDESIWKKLALCYRKGGKLEKAIEIYAKLRKEAGQQEDATFHLAALLAEKNPSKAFNLAKEGIEFSSKRWKPKFLQLSCYILIKRGRWKETLRLLDEAEGNPALRGSLLLLRPLVRRAMADLKSPLKAGLLSLLPGAGKIYAGRTKDGIYSFLLIAVSAWQAWQGFSKEGISSVKGWTFAGLGLFFYAGNIYGSVAAARIHNLQVREAAARALALTLGLKL